ncbi:MAG: Cell division protein FtsQ [Candidatus Roizmanbacteria bacterium GW2011_GWC2_37_13]|uniref:Cell division protein FtsQ n=1 Tax=Candidatus Roizmanbacteria bacterium GW2011_GWC2_37_13 TaxID=1618486 RepID=A0A0G0JE94_9BACT|nr:MAG: Cell division protein FtsQ [Candidatus Roizmanbacteria bacterium GW2011_GWC1_37_12]KKQ26486.1 MAG: Cell division protein FtsQ [Candidatus Roizmanbacteria bacterium GW2011_GWC2_37_13]
MPANLSSRKFLDKIRSFVFFVIVCLLIFIFFYTLNNVFAIKDIEIESDKKDLIGIQELKKSNLIFISQKEIKELIIKKNPEVDKVTIEKEYPSTLILKIKIERPIANLLVNQGYFYLSSFGKILLKSKNPVKELPIINYYQKLNFQSYSAGNVLTYKDIKLTLDLIIGVIDLGFKIVYIDISGVNMLLFNVGEKKIIFSSEKEAGSQLFQLQQIVKQFKVEGRAFKEIDLRYDKPVVRF